MVNETNIAEEKEMVTPQRDLPILETIARSWMTAIYLFPSKIYIFFIWMIFSIPVIMASAFINYWRVDALINSIYILLSAGLYCTLFCRRAFDHNKSSFSNISTAKSSIDTGLWLVLLGFIAFIVASLVAIAPHARDYGIIASLFEAISMIPWLGELFTNVFANPDIGLPTHSSLISGYFPGLGTPLIVSDPQHISDAITNTTPYNNLPQWGSILWLITTILATLIIILPLSLTIPAAALGHSWVNAFTSLYLCRHNIINIIISFIFTSLLAALIAAILFYAFSNFIVSGFLIDNLNSNPEGIFIFTIGLISLILAYLFFWHITCAFLAEVYSFLIRGKRISL